jgi:hypothetical protein
VTLLCDKSRVKDKLRNDGTMVRLSKYDFMLGFTVLNAKPSLSAGLCVRRNIE